ncbi:hypothetical protein [Roseococcus pinisoli]|uniref:GlcNAc-PI de-N-acetylase n=1 Tax=Roseococcus pinisoli TaxID=2835040 RepID=A0ABS5QHT9_9PROT|nr:hypothetical protein [Roseococcus pinisoli]MBS7813244.1 hypothetical protein [Roseococcus pinisoli]
MPLLLLAHPGHELRLFHWMERTRPLVFILTDGSGGEARSRTDHSVETIRRAGARIGGSVFGKQPDRAWYAALNAGDAVPFVSALEEITAEVRRAGAPSLVVADPVEGYNPMHDLCSALADGVAARLGASVQRRTFDLTETVAPEAAEQEAWALDGAALARKRQAVLDYAPLAEEARRLLTADPSCLGRERLLPCRFDWPDELPQPPAYEAFGHARVREGRYSSVVTYRDHVLPIARLLRGQLLRPASGVVAAA